MADYTLSVNIKGDSEEFKRALKAAQDAVDGFERKTSSVSQKMINVGEKMTNVGARMSLALTTPLVLGAKSAITAASDYDENLNKIDVAFGESGKAVKEWSETAIKEFGLSKNQALEAAALFGDMATSMGLTKPAASDMSISLASLAGDLASFKNIGVDQAMTALAGVFTGETESLKRLGIVMTETNLEEFAKKTGKVYKSMSQAEKVQLRYNYVMEMSKNAIGDYARTSDGTANSMRTFMGSVENLGIAFGKELLPVVTPLIQKATKMVEAFGDLSPETKQLTLKIGLLAAAMGPVTIIGGKVISTVGKMSNGIKTLTDSSTTLGKVSQNVFGIITKNPYTMAATAAVGFGFAIKTVVENMNAEVKAAQAAAEEREKMVASVQAENAQINQYYAKLKELTEVENKTAAQKKLMQTYVDKLNGSVEGLNLSYDEQTDSLNQTTDAIYKKIEAHKQEAIAAAYTKMAEEALADYAEKQMEATEKEQELAEIEQKIATMRSHASTTNAAELGNLESKAAGLRSEIDDLNSAQTEYVIEAQKATNQAQIQSGVWEDLLEQAGYTADQLSPTLISGINKGIYEIPTSVENLNSLIKFDQAVQNANLGGSETVKELATQIYNGEITIDDAIKQINASASSEMDKLPTKASSAGSESGKKYASSIKDKASAAGTAAATLAREAEKKAKADLYTQGANAGQGFVRGLNSVLAQVRNTAATIANIAIDAAAKAQDSHSPSKRWDKEIGFMGGKGYVNGMERAIPYAKKVGAKLSKAGIVAGMKSIDNIDYSYVQGRTIPQSMSLSYGTRGVHMQNYSGGEQAVGQNVQQTINIYQPVRTPAETARAIRKEATFGLAGA